MTFIVGLKCSDGIVVCADSLEDDGITKKTVDKIRTAGTAGAGGWGIAITGSGPGSTLDKFMVAIARRLPRGGPFKRLVIEGEIENELSQFNSKYVQTSADRFHVIIATYDLATMDRVIYKASCYEGQSVVLSPVTDECHTGMGIELWRMLSGSIYSPRNSVADNLRVAVFATRLAIKHASGVDGPVQAVTYTFGDQFWRDCGRADIQAIEKELSLKNFDDALRRYWRLSNPPSLTEQIAKYRGVRTPGDELTLLDGVKVEELSTISGLRRASKTFRRNTDRLQQHALLLKRRYREAQ